MQLLVATWATARKYLDAAWEASRAEDAAEAVVRAVEDDPEERSVGYGGSLTSDGRAELDAAFMEGAERRIGAVAGIEGFRHPVSVARAVLERSPHNLLAGEGAARFAARLGMEKRDMVSPEALAEHRALLDEDPAPDGHDTVGAIALCGGHFACAMSTSGLRFRAPGRVSDSPLPGCGFFCDDGVGVAVATGVGEDIMRAALAAKASSTWRWGRARRGPPCAPCGTRTCASRAWGGYPCSPWTAPAAGAGPRITTSSACPCGRRAAPRAWSGSPIASRGRSGNAPWRAGSERKRL